MAPATTPTVEQVQNLITQDVEAFSQAETSRRATLASMAQHVLALRALFTHDGRTDWTGKSADYKAAYSHAMATVPPDVESSLAASIRRYVGDALKAQLGPDGCAAYGLNPATSAERQQERQAKVSTAVRPVRPSELSAAETWGIIHEAITLEIGRKRPLDDTQVLDDILSAVSTFEESIRLAKVMQAAAA